MATAPKPGLKTPTWPYCNLAELEAAGYAYHQAAYCRGHGCGAAILWFYTPRNNHIAVNADDFQPHRTTCRDPERFQRRRQTRVEAQQDLQDDQPYPRRKR